MSWLSNKFSKFSHEGKRDGAKQIVCPHCGALQDISPKAELTFCRECKKIINARKAKVVDKEGDMDLENTPPPAEDVSESKKTREFKEYREPVKTSINLSSDSREPAPPPMSEVRNVKCSHCQTLQEVPTIALSSFCKKCGHRINLQDYEIRGKFQGDLDTRGTIFISEDAEVKANINVGNAVVRGKIQGTIIAEKTVKLAQAGKIFGKVVTPNFIVEDGAIFVGKAEINAEGAKE
ncbi:MAG: polymer-forming cytoskeletal protein [Candidatus Aureabacteria bacterium]|nr:polymer-forming cytoskeletal protein [Candidatus Auribacterota bacterium]